MYARSLASIRETLNQDLNLKMLSDYGFVSCLVFLIISLTVGKADGDQDLKNPTLDFRRHSIVQPVVLHGRTRREISTTRDENDAHHPEVTMSLSIDDEVDYILDLRLNRDLITDNHILSYQDNGRNVLYKPRKEELDLCHYGGSVRDKPGSWVAVSTCHGVQGIVFDGERMRYIEPAQDGGLNSQHYIYYHSDLIDPFLRGYVSNEVSRSLERHKKRRIFRSKRSADSNIHEPYNANEESYYVELALVADSGLYREHHYDKNAVHHQMLIIANYINALYSPLNIFVALVGVEVWGTDPITVDKNSSITLNNFASYKDGALRKKIPHDNAQLLVRNGYLFFFIKDYVSTRVPSLRGWNPSAGVGFVTYNNIQITTDKKNTYTRNNNLQEDFSGTTVGLGYLNTMCNLLSCAVASNHTTNIALLAMTMAHEMGHNFGMNHDENCECKEKWCVMNKYSTFTTHWSSCSLQTLKSRFSKEKRHLNDCLRNKPERLFESPTCGNGFVEPGEQCDCGTMAVTGAYNPCHACCDPNTCMLRTNATCGAGMCCDLQTCQLKSGGTICRAAQECDLPEYCDGRSEYCPDDVYVMDATSCKAQGMMCLAKECVFPNPYLKPKPVACPSGCSGRGVCNSKGHCHCDAGYAPPSCAVPGPGGSYDSGPATDTTSMDLPKTNWNNNLPENKNKQIPKNRNSNIPNNWNKDQPNNNNNNAFINLPNNWNNNIPYNRNNNIPKNPHNDWNNKIPDNRNNNLPGNWNNNIPNNHNNNIPKNPHNDWNTKIPDSRNNDMPDNWNNNIPYNRNNNIPNNPHNDWKNKIPDKRKNNKPQNPNNNIPNNRNNNIPKSPYNDWNNKIPDKRKNNKPHNPNNNIPNNRNTNIPNNPPNTWNNKIPDNRNNITTSNRNNSIPNHRNNELPDNWNKNIPKYRNNITPSNRNNITPSNRNNDIPNHRNNNLPDNWNRNIPKNRNNITTSNWNNDIPSNRDNNIPNHRDNDIPNHRNNIIPNNRNNNAPNNRNNIIPKNWNNKIPDNKNKNQPVKRSKNFMIAMYAIFLGIVPGLIVTILLFISRHNVLQRYKDYYQRRLSAKSTPPITTARDPPTEGSTGGACDSQLYANLENINHHKSSSKAISLPIQNKRKIAPPKPDSNINDDKTDLSGKRDLKITPAILKTTPNVHKISNAADSSNQNHFSTPSMQIKPTVNVSSGESDFKKSLSLVKLKPIANSSNVNVPRNDKMSIKSDLKTNSLSNEKPNTVKLTNENEHKKVKPPMKPKPGGKNLSTENAATKPSIKHRQNVNDLSKEKPSSSNLTNENEPKAKPSLKLKPNVINLSKEKASKISNGNNHKVKPPMKPKPNVNNLSRENDPKPGTVKGLVSTMNKMITDSQHDSSKSNIGHNV